MENLQKKKRKKNADLPQKDVPDDLLPEILCKLPTRSICRFKCVCKRWRDLFQDENFITRTRSKPPFEIEIQQNKVLRYYTIDNTRSVIAKSKKHYLGHYNYRRCNNLICYQSNSDHRKFYVLDLSTQQTYVLPRPPFELDHPYFNFEFGLDPCSNQYKVLVWKDGITPDYYILTLQGDGRRRSSSSWRKPFGVQISDFYSYDKSFVTTTGMIYLVDYTSLISFNLSTEDFRIIQLPPQLLQRRRDLVYRSECWYSLFEYEGCLCWVELSQKSLSQFKFNYYWEINGMWMLKDHVDVESNIWVKLMKDTTLPVPMYDRSISTTWSQKHSLFSSTPCGEIIITISADEYGLSCHPFLLLYSFQDQEFVEISI